MRKPIGLTSFLIQPAHFPHPNESFDNILQNIIPQWPSRCYHLVLSKQAPRLACFHSRHVHHLLMETHVREPVPQSRKVEARLKNPDQKQAFPMNFQIRVCFLWLYGSNFCICLDDSLVSVETRCGELPFFFFLCVDFIRQNTQIQTCFFCVWHNVQLEICLTEASKQEINSSFFVSLQVLYTCAKKHRTTTVAPSVWVLF